MIHAPYTLDAITARLIPQLTSEPSHGVDLAYQFPELSAQQLQAMSTLFPATRVPAAVLVALIQHPDGATMLFTERAGHLRHHAGQISFPGGRIEAGDADAKAAALREAQEEIGLDPALVVPLGFLPPRLVISGFFIHPLVAVVQPGFTLVPDRNEVADVFEVPLQHLLDTRNHQIRQRHIGAVAFQAIDISWGQHRIWGATANIIQTLQRLISDK